MLFTLAYQYNQFVYGTQINWIQLRGHGKDQDCTNNYSLYFCRFLKHFFSSFKLLWLTLTRIHSSCEVEFLPVYIPNEEEKRDPKLYARNVRNVMAK